MKSIVAHRFPNKGLVRTVGPMVIALSALSQVYGSGINFVMPQALREYPAVESWVPLAMLVAGIILIPQVVLFSRYSAIIPSAGSIYVWLTRTLGLYVGFGLSFLWFVGICGAMGFVAYTIATFLGNLLQISGFSGLWMQTKLGHLIIGLASIWSLTVLHLRGVKTYGYLVYVAGILIGVASLIIIITGFKTHPGEALEKLSSITGIYPLPKPAHPSIVGFISVIALFLFAYGGITAGASLGSESLNPRKNMPIGIIIGWMVSIILYTLIAFSLFHAVPWWAAEALVNHGAGHLLTAPTLVGLFTTHAAAIFINVLVVLIVAKTIAPQLLSASRLLYFWSKDGIINKNIQTTNRFRSPSIALLISALLGSFFLIDAIYAGWAIGVIVRAASIAATFSMLGLATLILAWVKSSKTKRSWADSVTRGWLIKFMALCGFLIGATLVTFVVYEPGVKWFLQPWFQIIVSFGVSIVIAVKFRLHSKATGNQDYITTFYKLPKE